MGMTTIPKQSGICTMADDESPENLSSEDLLLARHRKEKKELQAHVQHLKKNMNKDKKKKKETTEEITRLETELKARHEKELAEVKTVSNGIACISLVENSEEIHEESNVKGEEDLPQVEAERGKKMSKAEKRRQKKAEANREREARIQEEEANNKYCARNVEADKLKKLLRERNLKMFEIQPNGDCMYAAIAHQMGGDTTVSLLRSKASQHIQANYDDFAPFITNSQTGDMLTKEEFAEYCRQIEHTPAWGGQPELRALSLSMKRRIEVLQAEGSPVIFGEEHTSEKKVILAYYRHYYGLGEHYNSAIEIDLANEEDS